MCDELLWFTHASASDVYNQPTHAWAYDADTGRVELTPTGSRRDARMSEPDGGAPQFLLLIGDTHGREPAPLPGLPAGVIAVTVPRVTRTEDDLPDVRVPRDRKGRVNTREVDLVAAAPVNGYAPPPGLSTRLDQGTHHRDHKRWPTIEGEFGERAWDVTVALIQCGAITLRCRVERAVRYAPRLWRLTEIWEDVREDKLDELRGRPDALVLHAELLEARRRFCNWPTNGPCWRRRRPAGLCR
ncbi:hypothetical protein ACFVTY_31110 [Streptomyces sp. NPDC058067]|uniref:hypothetical protein n=1 Tax=Streptomyces sp. NPDC058067 TaxID=3346324 RepID=UPI0036EF4BD6